MFSLARRTVLSAARTQASAPFVAQRSFAVSAFRKAGDHGPSTPVIQGEGGKGAHTCYKLVLGVADAFARCFPSHRIRSFAMPYRSNGHLSTWQRNDGSAQQSEAFLLTLSRSVGDQRAHSSG